jgi:hypothetical protein
MIAIDVVRRSARADGRTNEPVTVGIPLPKGSATETSGWRVISDAGTEAPLQTRVLDRWSDGSIRWALVDSVVSIPEGSARARLSLALSGGPQERAASPIAITPITIAAAPGRLTVDTGAASFDLSASRSAILDAVRDAAGRAVIDPESCALRVTSDPNTPWRIAWDDLSVEEPGSCRTVVRADGEARGPSNARVRLTARLHFFAGLPVVRVLLTIRNPARAQHAGGFWELGDPGSVLLRELSLTIARRGGQRARLRASLDESGWTVDAANVMHLYQASSGGANWASTNHLNRDHRVPEAFRGYRVDVDGQVREGDRAAPIVVLDEGGSGIGVSMPRFWQNCPRALAATPEAVTIAFFPGEHASLHELQGGEQKTHECYLLFGADPVTAAPLEWCRSRLVAHALPEWYAQADAVPFATPASSTVERGYQSLVDAAIEGADTFEAKRERIDEYGWRHFGDIYGDHEAVFLQGPSPLVSHYNNQYDPVGGFACQFMRSGDVRWWTQCEELAAHVTDIDVYHTDEDKSAYNHGLFWHTVHYVDAGTCTHRTYPRAKGSNGGGPSSEHNYPTGLMLHHLMTGDAASRESALGLAQFVIDIDDGDRTPFRWLARGATGLASASRSFDYHGPGRGSGNSLNALVDGHRLTRDRRFLDKAEEIIRRCTHPEQDVAALNLLDAENRWFYTMYLQALGKYLDHKIETGELDAMYAYGRGVLLHFARWMAEHERPYLDHPEILEFPTETWPAQDIRKSDVFHHAARHASDAERPRFAERAEFFFRYAVTQLATMPTRTLARPVVLLLSNGVMHERLTKTSIANAPQPNEDWRRWPAPERFEPQKVRAKRRAIWVAGAGAILLAALVLSLAIFSCG